VRTTRDVRVGELLIEEGLISEEQLGAVLAEQLATRAYVPLGQILVEKGLVTRKQLTIILDRHHKRPRLGQLLLRNGSITEAQLQIGLQRHVQQRRPLGEVLVASGFVTDDAVRQALAIQALDRGCSDIHIEMLASHLQVQFRIDRVLHAIDLGPGMEAFDRNGERVGIDFRVSVLPGYYGESVVLRILDKARAPTGETRGGCSVWVRHPQRAAGRLVPISSCRQQLLRSRDAEA